MFGLGHNEAKAEENTVQDVKDSNMDDELSDSNDQSSNEEKNDVINNSQSINTDDDNQIKKEETNSNDAIENRSKDITQSTTNVDENKVRPLSTTSAQPSSKRVTVNQLAGIFFIITCLNRCFTIYCCMRWLLGSIH